MCNTSSVVDQPIKELFIRPVQDVTKACYYLIRKKINFKLEILENLPVKDASIKNKDLEVHADVNIIGHLPVTSESYIGVSRLCCACCHYTLEQYKYFQQHRGTHGVCFNPWPTHITQFKEVERNLKVKAEELADRDYNDFKLEVKRKKEVQEKMGSLKEEINKIFFSTTKDSGDDSMKLNQQINELFIDTEAFLGLSEELQEDIEVYKQIQKEEFDRRKNYEQQKDVSDDEEIEDQIIFENLSPTDFPNLCEKQDEPITLSKLKRFLFGIVEDDNEYKNELNEFNNSNFESEILAQNNDNY